MATNKPVFTLRMDDITLKKIKYIAKVTKRSTAMQIELACEEYVKDFEKIHGIIKEHEIILIKNNI